MGGLDPAKILIILLLGMIILGPERLPRVARQIGAAWHELSRLRDRLEEEVRNAVPDLDLPKIPTLPARGITGYLGNMMLHSSSGSGAARARAASDAAPTPLLGSVGDASDPPAGRAAPEIGGGRSPRGPSQWQGSGFEAAGEHSELPAGWNAPGASGPGFASGSVLAPVPSSMASSQLGMEAPLSFDEPSWN